MLDDRKKDVDSRINEKLSVAEKMTEIIGSKGLTVDTVSFDKKTDKISKKSVHSSLTRYQSDLIHK